VSVFANVSSATTSMSRLTAAMAEQRLLPRLFAARWANGTPAASTLFYGGIAALLASSGSFVFLAVVSSLARLFAYASCVAAVPRIDMRNGVVRPLRGMLLPALAFLLCLWAATQASRQEWATFGAFFVAGSILFLLARRSGRATI
jgi:amino acid transporter